MNIFKAGLSALLLAAATFSATATPITYPHKDGNLSWWGTGKTETYDIAAYLGPDMKGLEIQSLTFQAPADPELTGFSIWLSEQLNLDDQKKNAPDILSADTEVKDGRISLALSQPYTIGENGVYIGYSFTAAKKETDRQKAPILIMTGGDPFGHSIYVHTSKTYGRWAKGSTGANTSLPFEVVLENAPDHSVKIELPDEVNGGVGTDITFDAGITNFGALGASSIKIEWAAGSASGNVRIPLQDPLPQIYAAYKPFKITIPAFSATESTELKIKVTEVDDNLNAYPEYTAATTMNIWSKQPVRRVLLEEYTGTGCGYCPRGAVGIDRMESLYGDDFVGVAYHFADIMAIMEEFPSPAPSLPVAWLNRTRETDPYFGDNGISGDFGIDKVWTDESKRFSPVDIELECDWTDSSHSSIEAKANATFVKPFENSDLRFSFMLVADGLNGKTVDWLQGNYYSGQTGKWPSDLDIFVNAPSYIEGMTYNDVVILSPAPLGIKGSIPEQINEGQTVSCSETLSLSDAINLDGTKLAQDGLEYSIVALVIDGTTGEVLNCIKNRLGKDGISETPIYGAPVSTTCYDLYGRRLSAAPDSGIYVEIRKYADGNCVVRKIIAK